MNNKLYDENLNPTDLMSEFFKDIRNSGIYDVLLKYSDILPPHEVIGFITSELHCKSAQLILKKKINKRNES